MKKSILHTRHFRNSTVKNKKPTTYFNLNDWVIPIFCALLSFISSLAVVYIVLPIEKDKAAFEKYEKIYKFSNALAKEMESDLPYGTITAYIALNNSILGLGGSSVLKGDDKKNFATYLYDIEDLIAKHYYNKVYYIDKNKSSDPMAIAQATSIVSAFESIDEMSLGKELLQRLWDSNKRDGSNLRAYMSPYCKASKHYSDALIAVADKNITSAIASLNSCDAEKEHFRSAYEIRRELVSYTESGQAQFKYDLAKEDDYIKALRLVDKTCRETERHKQRQWILPEKAIEQIRTVLKNHPTYPPIQK